MNRLIKSLVAGLSFLAMALLLIMLHAGPSMAAGNLTNGLPPAGGTQYPNTIPFTGVETIPADTNLTQGLNPASEAISVNQLIQAIVNPQGATATNTSAFTATTAQMGISPLFQLNLTGTLGAGAAVTTPTASALTTAFPQLITAQNGSSAFFTYVLQLRNQSSGAFAWTLTGGTGVTVNGTATVAQNTSRNYLVACTNATTCSMTALN